MICEGDIVQDTYCSVSKVLRIYRASNGAARAITQSELGLERDYEVHQLTTLARPYQESKTLTTSEHEQLLELAAKILSL